MDQHQYEKRKQLKATFEEALIKVERGMSRRQYRPEAFVEKMHELVNVERERGSLSPLTLDDVRRVERLALGHFDYGSKFALYCMELAMGESPIKTHP